MVGDQHAPRRTSRAAEVRLKAWFGGSLVGPTTIRADQLADLDFSFDVFNLTNSASTTSIYDNINQTFPITGDDAFAEARRIVLPRQIRLSVRFVY